MSAFRKGFQWSIYLIGGIFFLGTLLDALGNAISIFNLKNALIATVLLTSFYFVLSNYVRKNGLSWYYEGEVHKIKKINIRVKLFFIGMLLLIWVSVAHKNVYISNSSSNSSESLQVQMEAIEKAIALRNHEEYEAILKAETGHNLEELKLIAENVKEKSGSNFDLANARFFLNNFQDAIVFYDKAIAINPVFVPAHINKGLALLTMGESEKAVRSFDEALKFEFDTNFRKSIYMNKALALTMLDSLERAIITINNAISLDDKYEPLYVAKTNILYRQKKYEEAINTSDIAIGLNSKTLAYQTKSEALLRLNKFEEALKNFLRRLSLFPSHKETYLGIAKCYEKLGNFSEAIIHYNLYLRYNPNSAEAHFRMGISLGQVHQYTKAIESLNNAIKLDSTIVDGYCNKARYLDLLGDYEGAIKNYDIAIQLDSSHAHAFIGRGNCFLRLGKTKEADNNFILAIRHYSILLDSDVANLDTHYNLGVLLNRVGQFEKAIFHFRKVIEVNSKDAEVYFKIGVAFKGLGNDKEAENYFNQAYSFGYKD